MHRLLRPAVLAALLAAVALFLAACNGADEAAAPADAEAQEITLETGEFFFEPDTITIPADTEVTVVIDNSGGMVEHDFTLDEAGADVYAGPGETASGSFSVAAGTYEFYCSIPGHRESGMVGTLTAE